MSKKTIEFSKSSLLSLKAEVLRKQQEVTNSKLNATHYVRTTAPLKKKVPKNPGVDERNARDEIEPVDEDVLTKSRLALEAKAKLYDKLSKTKDSDPDCTFLVQFDKKLTEMPENEPELEEPNTDRSEEWVEYVDYLGRSRVCLRKDLPSMQQQYKVMDVPEPEAVPTEEEKVQEEEKESFIQSNLQLKEEWEKREEELAFKKDVHYQDVLFNEARAHGVGYYNFSFDEEERAKQQANLKNLRNETKSKQQTVQEMREAREKQMAARAKAARNRKRARMGLPPEEDETPEPEPEHITPLPIEIDKIKVEEDKKAEKLRKTHIRPWDIGKEGVKPIQTQEQWVSKKRSERIAEFAPPVETRREEILPDEEEENRSLFFTSKSSNRKRPSVNPYKRSVEEEPPKYKRRNETVIEKIENEVKTEKYDPFEEEDDDGEEEEPRINEDKYAKVPPPTTFDYYGPSSSSKTKSQPKNVTKIQESIEAGLKFLRKQSERKHAHTEHVGYFD